MTKLELGAAWILLSATTAVGAEPRPNTAAVVQAVAACRAVAESAERLACFDRTARGLDEAIARREVVVVEQQEVRRARRSLFGFDLPSLAIFGRSDKNEPPFVTIDSTVTRVTNAGYGRYDVTIEDGAAWRNIELLDAPPRLGEKVRIDKTSLGGYFMKTRFDRAVRAQRVR